MSQLTFPSSLAHKATVAGTCCEECGYDLRGSPQGGACPECGRHQNMEAARIHPHVAWARAVFIGLCLLLVLVLNAICSVLIQPNDGNLTATVASLNVPGPKLWAVPLLQRPIGQSPRLPGVVGTRSAMLSLLAIWLITVSGTGPRAARAPVLRATTRWVSVILFGLGFGMMLSCNGLWPNELPPFRAMMVAGVELPAAALLYAWLLKLSQNVPGRNRREQFERLVWFVPGVIATGAFLLILGWWQDSTRSPLLATRQAQLMIGAVYGALAMACGVAATGAVGSLASAYFQLAFPQARRLIIAGRYLRRRAMAVGRSIRGDRARRLAVAGGLGLLLLVMIVGNDRVLWMSARQGVGGNLVFVNFPGPKIWSASMLTEYRGDSGWQTLVSRTTALALELLALWLITIPLGHGADRRDRLRQSLRWLAPLLIGAALFAMAGIDRVMARVTPGAGWAYWQQVQMSRSEFFAAITIGCELPLTLLLYAVLARLAGEQGRPALRRQFRLITLAVVGLVGASIGAMILSRRFLADWNSVTVIVLGAVYGAVVLCVVIWSTVNVVRLMGALLFEPK